MTRATYLRHGRGESLGSLRAKNDGLHPASYWAKMHGLSTDLVRTLCGRPTERHHTGKYATLTDFYRWPFDTDDRDDLASALADAIAHVPRSRRKFWASVGAVVLARCVEAMNERDPRPRGKRWEQQFRDRTGGASYHTYGVAYHAPLIPELVDPIAAEHARLARVQRIAKLRYEIKQALAHRPAVLAQHPAQRWRYIAHNSGVFDQRVRDRYFSEPTQPTR